MLYSTCPTCGTFIGMKIYKFEQDKEKICNNPKLDEESQGKEIEKLIKSLNFRRYCCRMRVMCYKDLVKDILPVEQ